MNAIDNSCRWSPWMTHGLIPRRRWRPSLDDDDIDALMIFRSATVVSRRSCYATTNTANKWLRRCRTSKIKSPRPRSRGWTGNRDAEEIRMQKRNYDVRNLARCGNALPSHWSLAIAENPGQFLLHPRDTINIRKCLVF